MKRPKTLHTKKPWATVYHNNPKCPERNNVENKNIAQGTGGLRLCSRCADLNKRGVK